LALTSDRYARLTRRLWNHRRLAELFPRYLIRLHGVVRAGVPLMEAAVEQARRLDSSDPVASHLIDYFSEHIPEEKDHDEWLLNDIVDLGFSRASILAEVPSPLIASVVGAQYYWIRHQHPAALMGYMFLLEGNPPTVEHVERIKAATGLPECGFRCLMHHAVADVGHREDLFRTLDAMPLTVEQRGLVGLNATWSQHLLAESLAAMLDEFEGETARRPSQPSRRRPMRARRA
jgi:pyrroloquinoline quinone (PQQ) biosynthesis protein C